MDSLTQLVLGSAIGVAVMGRRTAVWKSALWGGVAGTLPDLDALVDHGDAVLNMVLHRAETHALFYHLLASFPLAWLVARLNGEMAQWRRWWLATLLVLTTHALLDAVTVYGTQLLLPFTDEAFGVGSLFIIDPAYSLPLLVGVGLALTGRHIGLQANRWGLVISTCYIGWSFMAQAWVTDHARESLARSGLQHERLLVTPAPFSTILWRVLAVDGDTYHEGYYALLDRGRTIQFRSHDRGVGWLDLYAGHEQVQRIARFSDGFYRLRKQDGDLLLADLRMGQEPSYVFEFNIGPPPDSTPLSYPVATQIGARGDIGVVLPWLRARLLGQDLPPLSDIIAQHATPRSPIASPTRPLDTPLPQTTLPRLP